MDPEALGRTLPARGDGALEVGVPRPLELMVEADRGLAACMESLDDLPHGLVSIAADEDAFVA
ncbi:hypothetical protein JM654_16530 [Microbacterium oxydans]|nr:hypothetical protein [Microbacterium oxydans]